MLKTNNLQVQSAKKIAANRAAEFVKEGMTIGIGTGSTVYYFIEKLIELAKKGLKIKAVATSLQSEELAKNGGIPIVDINTLTTLDLYVDGADEITMNKWMIKGGGGALLREKIVATMSREKIIIVDENKVVSQLGHFPLPVEIIPFGFLSTIKLLNDKGYYGKIRTDEQKKIYKTDNGNYIYDIKLSTSMIDLSKTNLELIEIVGVVETGVFINLADKVIVGQLDGHIREY